MRKMAHIFSYASTILIKIAFMMPNNLLSHIFEVEMATHINLPKFVLQKVSTLWAQSKGD
jgi:hypothetical protein